MNTKFVGIKEFRQNISKYAKGAKKTRYVVVRHKKPLFEIKSFDDDESIDSLFESIQEARRDVAEGRVYTHEQIMKMLS